MTGHYSTTKVSDKLLAEIKDALENLDYGSIELYIQNSTVTQITKRLIKKTTESLKSQLTNSRRT